LTASHSKLAIKRRIRLLAEAAKRHGCSAACAAGTLLRTWCDIAYPSTQRPCLPFSKTFASESEAVSFVELLCQLDFLEATYWLSSVYAMLAEDAYRKKLAMFFTPASLTKGLLDDLVEQGVEFESQSFLDPACGGAAFLAPIALRMRDALLTKGVSPIRLLKHIEANLYGTDLDKTLCELSRHFLCMALNEEIKKAGYVPTFQVHNVNSLTNLKAQLGEVDVVVCNPPYRKMSAQELEPLRAVFGEIIDAQPNLYGLFIALCVNLLRVGGYAAIVTPTSFLSGKQFCRLRRFLMRHTDIAHIGMVSDRFGVFIDVEQETALTIMRRRDEEDRSTIRANVSVVSGTGKYKNVGECVLPNEGRVWPIPRSMADVELLKVASLSEFRLSDYGYKVRIGAYVWNRDLRPKYETLKKAKRAKARAPVPLLWSRDISVASSVRLGKESATDGESRFVDVGQKAHSSVVTSPSVVIQRVTSNDQHRRLVAAAVSTDIYATYGGFIGENHVVIVEQVTDRPALSPSKLAKLLSTHVVDRYFRCISGATNVSVFELNQLALPNPRDLKEALSKGSSMEDAAAMSFGFLRGN
jgi:adenine-specific DNA-methyltransferase